jgi:D-alanyl-D-alanine-carboxypeptidase/D-alanyl-D-alanine-endopeptidase
MNQREMKSPKIEISKKQFVLSVLVMGFLIASHSARSQSHAEFGYLAKGDSIEFIFGQEKTIVIGGQIINLQDRFNEIKAVNVAGDFNNWNPKDVKYVAVMGNDKIFRLTIAKKHIGKKGETRQFKFVINQEHWVEPPKEALNQFTGKDGYTNLTLKL